MKNIHNHVKGVLGNALLRCASLPALEAHAKNVVISVCNPKFGDFQWNEAISLFKTVGSSLGVSSPRELAEMVKNHISDASISSASVSPQGFLNLTLSNAFLSSEVANICREGVVLKQAQDNSNMVVVVDFSSPNIAKEMHVGHLRSTIIGESIARILEFCGYKVLRINHLGDWGTHFGMLVEHLFDKYPDFMENVPSITDFTNFYKQAKIRMENDPDFQAASRRRVVMLQSRDETSIQVWKLLCKISSNEFEKIYKRLDIKLEAYGESFYNDMIADVVKELRDKGLVTESEGATCIFTNCGPIPLMAIKSDGSYGYDSTDLACIWYRIHKLGAKWIIYVTDVGQSDHFQKIFDTAARAQWTQQPEYNVRVDHVGFGMVQDERGLKFKTRSGDTVKLCSLLDEAVARATSELQSRQGEGNEVDLDAAEALGMASIKYFDLKQTLKNNYKFSFDAMLDPRGNTAVYLLYAYARIVQIFKRANIDKDAYGQSVEAVELEHPTETTLAKTLLRFTRVVDEIQADFATHKMAEYLYAVSVDFSAFYKQCKVVGHDKQDSRLALCLATIKCMQVAFKLLGITPLEKI